MTTEELTQQIAYHEHIIKSLEQEILGARHSWHLMYKLQHDIILAQKQVAEYQSMLRRTRRSA